MFVAAVFADAVQIKVSPYFTLHSVKYRFHKTFKKQLNAVTDLEHLYHLLLIF